MGFVTPAINILKTALQAAMGQAVTYKRGGDTIDGLSAIPVKVRNSELLLSDTPVTVTNQEQDWIITVADLAIAGQLIVPKTGDVILWAVAGATRRFKVKKRLGDRTYRYADPTRLLFRVYTEEAAGSTE